MGANVSEKRLHHCIETRSLVGVTKHVYNAVLGRKDSE